MNSNNISALKSLIGIGVVLVGGVGVGGELAHVIQIMSSSNISEIDWKPSVYYKKRKDDHI